MATQEQQAVEKTEAVSDDTQQAQVEQQETDVNVDSVEAKIAELQEQLAKQQEIVDKARKGEKYQKSQRDADVKKVQAQYEAEKARADGLEQRVRDIAADGVLRQTLSENGAKAVDTALKLIDRKAIKFGDYGAVDVESIKAVVEALKASDSILFGEPPAKPKAPPAVRATEGTAVNGFEAEMKAARSVKDIQAVLRKEPVLNFVCEA